MKTVFFETRFKGKIDYSKIKADKLTKNVCLITTIQFVSYLDEIKGFLEKKGINAFIGKGKQIYGGQILGCDVSSALECKDKAESFLYIGDGRFHPTALAYREEKKVFCFNPFSLRFDMITEKEVNDFRKKKKVKLVKYLSSKNIGILVSTKPGQNNYKKALELRKEIEKKGKNASIFLFDNLNMMEMDNFNFIEMWVNTACPRIEEDSKKIINYRDLV